MSDTVVVTRPWPTGAAAQARLPRLLAAGQAGRTDLAHHLAAHGPVPYRGTPHQLIEEIRAAGLTGRGGAAFPTAVKMTAVAGGRASPVVVGNGAEGEPASDKDKHLLSSAPHLVLDGLQLAAEAIGAGRAYLYVHRHDRLHRLLGRALAERSAARRDRVAVELVPAPPRFLAGEESALVSRVNRGLALPTFKQPRVFERGVGGAPTLVQNVETLAHVALIARHGAAWFRLLGTAEEPGSMLVTCHRADATSQVAEVAVGAPLAGLLRLGSSPVQAVLTGGYHGTWIPAAQAAGLPLSNAAMRATGAALGAGVLAALPADRCGLAETARVVRYLAAESAGQCGPCLAGLPRIADALTRLSAMNPDVALLAHLERWTGLVTGRGACHHPDGTVRFVRTALEVFGGEIDRHRRGDCAADRARAPFLPVPATPVPATPVGPHRRDHWR